MKSMIMKIALMTVGAGLLAAAGCGDDGVRFNKQALDEDGDGFCDMTELERMIPDMIPDQLELYEAPVDLRIRVRMADGISPPVNGRIALLTYLHPWPDGPFEQRLLFDSALPDTFPAELSLHLPRPPGEILDLVRISDVAPEPLGGEVYNAGEARLSGHLVVYDDRNGNGRMDLGLRYLSHPAMDADDAAWDRFTEEAQEWEDRYGHLDFIQLSSPSDPDNEVLSRANIVINYLDNALSFDDDTVRVDGYQFALEEDAVAKYVAAVRDESGVFPARPF